MRRIDTNASNGNFTICQFDPFGKDMHKYEFRELCKEDRDVELGDGTAKVFINAKGRREDASPEMTAFLDYLCGKEASSDITRDIDSGVAKVKRSGTIEEEYMYVARPLRDAYKQGRDEGRAESRKEGRKEGRADATFEAVDRLVAEGAFNVEKACDVLGVSLDEYKDWKKERDSLRLE